MSKVDTVSEIYDIVESIVDENPQMYIMPNSVFNLLMKKVAQLETDVKNARKSRENWRKKYYDIKNG